MSNLTSWTDIAHIMLGPGLTNWPCPQQAGLNHDTNCSPLVFSQADLSRRLLPPTRSGGTTLVLLWQPTHVSSPGRGPERRCGFQPSMLGVKQGSPSWISNYIHHKVCDEITCLLLNFNGNRYVISSQTLLGVWLLSHVGIEVDPCVNNMVLFSI